MGGGSEKVTVPEAEIWAEISLDSIYIISITIGLTCYGHEPC